VAKKAQKKLNAQKKYRVAEVDNKVDEESKKENEEIEAKRKLEEAAAKKEAGKKYRLTLKDFNQFCCTKMPGSGFDRWFIEEFVKKFKTQEVMDEVYDRVKSFDDATFESSFQDLVDEQDKTKYAAKLLAQKKEAEEAKKQEGVFTGKNWDDEDVANLTKAIK
jgi:hypothetical protein